jgi:hypothetical protein
MRLNDYTAASREKQQSQIARREAEKYSQKQEKQMLASQKYQHASGNNRRNGQFS